MTALARSRWWWPVVGLVVVLAAALIGLTGCSEKRVAGIEGEIETWQGARHRCVRITYFGQSASGTYINKSGGTQDLPPAPQLLCGHPDGTITPVRPDDVKEIRWGK